MALQALKPIALYRLEDTIVFWNDTPVGWDLVNMFGSLPAEGRRVVAELLVESAPAFPQTTDPVVVCDFKGVQGVPADMPSYALVGIHSDFWQEDVPVWSSGEPDPREGGES